MEQGTKPWIMRILDENANIGPVSGIVVAGAVGFILVLGILVWRNSPGTFARFFPIPQPHQEVLQIEAQKAALLASLSTPASAAIPEAEKMKVLRSLVERVDKGEQPLFLSERDKLKVLASLSTAH